MQTPAPFKVVRQAVVAERTLTKIRARFMDPKEIWGVPYGFDLLDHATGGIHAVEDSGTNELAILAARSNVGKSSLAISIAINVATTYKKHYSGLQVRIITLEMSPDALMKRTLGQLADVPLWRLNTGRMDLSELGRIEKAERKLASLPISYIEGSYDINAIEDFITRKDTKTNQNCGYFILDHVGIVPSDTANRTANHTFALGQISRQLHHVARKTCPGLVLAQLNRDSLKRKDPTPNASDIAQSDKILQDADLVLLLHRPEMFGERRDNDDESSEIAYCIIEKNREGAAGRKLPMSFTPRLALWGDLPQQEEPPD